MTQGHLLQKESADISSHHMSQRIGNHIVPKINITSGDTTRHVRFDRRFRELQIDYIRNINKRASPRLQLQHLVSHTRPADGQFKTLIDSKTRTK